MPHTADTREMTEALLGQFGAGEWRGSPRVTRWPVWSTL
jgi:hypothetical protein